MKGIYKWIKELLRILKQKYKDMKFRHKLLVTYTFIGVIPISVLGVFCYYQAKSMLIEHENTNMQDCLDQAVLSIENQIDIYNNLSDYIAYNQTIADVINYDYTTSYEMYENLTNILDPMLASLKYFHSKVNQVTIYTSNDIVEHDTTVAPLSKIENTSWYKEVISQTSRDILWFVDQKAKKAFSVRIMPSLEGTTNPSVLYIDVEYDDLFSAFSEMTSVNYGVYLIDENENVIYSNEKFRNDQSYFELTYKGLQQEVSAGDSSDYTIVQNATKYGWNVLLYKPNSLIMSSIFNIVIISVLVTLCCAAASVLAATGISKFMVSGIEKLTENMNSVQNGNMEITVKSTSKDEVGNLIRGFGMMIERINLLINEVYEGEIAQKEYEMKALQAQINPHFLYNSLSLINWKAIEAEKMDISKITLLLSTFYRTALNRGDNILPVRDEITNMKCYLDIQLMMHENNFDVEIDIPEEMYEYITLNLILQPIVENAIDHGIDLLTDRKGIIKITGEVDQATIRFIVEDNGVGMDEEKAQTILTERSKGYGIRNVNERIKLLYGQEYSMQVRSKVGIGTTIIVQMPAIKKAVE